MSSQQDRGGTYNESKSRATVSAQQCGDKTLSCLKHCRKTANQVAMLPAITRTRSAEKRHHQPLGQYFNRKCTSMKQKETALGAKHFCCIQFEKRFTQNSHFTRHMENRRRERYGCQICPKTVSVANHLSTHTQTHTRNETYCFQKCGKRFSKAGHLFRHMRTHTGKKLHRCQECGKRFSHDNTLKTHMRTHTGEKPFCCKDCGKRFAQAGNLTTHKRTRTGEKPYCCQDCGKRFSQANSLTIHTRTRTGEKLHLCQGCGKGSCFAGQLAGLKPTHNWKNGIIAWSVEQDFARQAFSTHTFEHTSQSTLSVLCLCLELLYLWQTNPLFACM